MSRSIVRAAPGNVRTRPSERSTASSASSSECGVSEVSASTAAFRNHGCCARPLQATSRAKRPRARSRRATIDATRERRPWRARESPARFARRGRRDSSRARDRRSHRTAAENALRERHYKTLRTDAAGFAAPRRRNVCTRERWRRVRAACGPAGRASSSTARKFPRWRLLPR